MSQTEDLRAHFPGAASRPGRAQAAVAPPPGAGHRRHPGRAHRPDRRGQRDQPPQRSRSQGYAAPVRDHAGADPPQKFLAWYNATGQHDVLTLTRDTSTVTADENSGDTAALQRDGTTLRNDSIAAIAHPNPPIDPADWGNAMTASMLGAGLGAVMGKLTTTGLGSAFQD